MLTTTAFDQDSAVIRTPSRLREALITALMAAALMLVGGLVAPATASAQCESSGGSLSCNSRVTPDAKGMIGLGLIGAELGFIVPALVQDAAHTDEWWPYVVFPLVGAGVGVLSGYFVEEATQNEPEVDIVLMGVGMALIVPTILGTLALTAYSPDDGGAGHAPDDDDYVPPDYEDGTTTEAVQVEDAQTAPTTDETAPAETSPPAQESEPAEGGSTSSVRTRIRALMAGGPGVLRFRDNGAIILAAPLVHGGSTYSRREMRDFQLEAGYDVIVPVVSGEF